ncbi:MAG: alpha-galactosidase [Clostridia bacterium]|nr:alpha-galactosidase [Clostridia bacterium]
MSITYSDGIIHIQGKSTSLCLMVHPEFGLLNLYWGARLPDGNVAYVLDGITDGASFDLKSSRMPYDLPLRGSGYYQTPALCAVNNMGNDLVKLSYVSHEIYRGKKHIPGLPQVYTEEGDGAQSAEILLTDALTGLTACVTYTLIPETDVITRSMKVINAGNSPVTLTHMMSASIPLYGSDYDVINLSGAWARERHINRTPLAHYGVRIESQRGASGHEQNPFIALSEKTATEHTGSVWAMALVYSGSFLAACDVNNFHTARLSIGLNPETCSWKLMPSEEFQTPEAVLVYSGGGFNGMSQKFHSTIRRRIVRGYWRDEVRPILINNWEATYFNFNEEKIEKIARKAANLGIELFVLDDGWFGRRNTDNCSLGDWVVNTDKLPGGIRGIAEKINGMGMKFGLWFEPEMVSPDSDLYRAHPDWCLHAEGRSRTEARQQLILNLSRREVQDYIISAVSAVLRDAPIDYVKWDMNRNMTEYFSYGREADRQMETQHRYMLGLYRVMDEITSAFPKVLFEGCSGGGGRFDMGMLYYMPQFWTSDDTDPVERLKIQYGTSFVYPASAMGAHVSASPNHQTFRNTSVKMRADVALGGNFGFELDLNTLTDEETASVKESIEFVKKVRKTLQTGTFIRLESPFEGNYAAWEFVSEDQSTVILAAYRRLTAPNPCMKKIFLKSLDENSQYINEQTGKTYSGAALMHAGILFPDTRRDYQSMIQSFRKA